MHELISVSLDFSAKTPKSPSGFSLLMYILTKGIRFHQSNQIRLVHINVTLWIRNPDNLTLIHAQWNQVPQFLPVQLHGDRSFSLRR